MIVEDINSYLNEYFNYIKTVFLNEYSKYLNETRIDEIKQLNNVFKINLENKFRIYCSEKINVNLNIKEFIEENRLNNDSDLKDISIDGKIFIKYLVDNQNNLKEIILSQILNPIITYLIGTTGVLSKGTIDMITEHISAKYKLPYKTPFKSKELNIVKELVLIVGEKQLIAAVLNNDYKEIEQIYNQNSEYDTIDFVTLLEELDKEYSCYSKKLGRVYYTDSLYDYQSIDYKVCLDSINKTKDNKNKQMELQKERFVSAYESLKTLQNHLIVFSSSEQVQIKNYLVEINHLIEKLETDIIHIDIYYKKLLMLENSALPLVEKLWKAELTHPLNYKEGSQFCFLVGPSKKTDKDFIETQLFTEKHLIYLNSVNLKYGIIYGIDEGAIIYSSSKDILITSTKSANEDDLTKMKVNDNYIEIDNQSDSKMVTPDFILKRNVKDNEMKGKVLLNSKRIKEQAIYCVIEDELDYNYERAKELSEMYDLPLILIYKKLYIKSDKYYVSKKIDVKEEQKEIKNSVTLADKIRKFKSHLLYEEDDENLKKVI